MPAKILLAVLLAFSCSCMKQATTAPPNSPQTTVALTIQFVADSTQSGVKTVIALRDQGKLSQANTTIIENWLGLVAQTDKQISAILAKPEDWTTQKREIFLALTGVQAPLGPIGIDPGAQAVIAQIMTLINQIRAQVQP